MASVILLCLCAGVLFYNIYKYMFYKPPNFPPGPPRIPIFGSYLFVLLINYSHIEKAINILCKYYNTNILGLYLGTFPAIVLNDANTVKESLFHKDFDGKPPVLLSALRDPDFVWRGIFFVDGPFWKNQRRYTLRHLRDYGFGRRFEQLEIETAEEISSLIDLLKNGPKYDFEKKLIENGNAAMPLIFSACSGKTFLKILTNERRSREKDGELYDVSKHTFIFQKVGSAWGKLFSIKALEFLATLFPHSSGYKPLRDSSMEIHAFLKNIIDEQLKTYDPEHVRSILDLYFKEMNESNDKKSYFHYEQLIMICVDFIFPVITAIPVTITYFLKRIVLQPEIQEKIQQEIDDVVGRGRLPTLDDRIKLSYTEACLRELMRHETLVPTGLPHYTLENTSFNGYDIPKGTVVFTHLCGLHMDVKKWKNPNEFIPERFLDINGKLSLKKDHSLPFGAGKRLCAGETFARNMVFLMITALVQNFNIKALNGPDSIPTNSQTGFIIHLPEFRLKFEAR